MLELLIDDISTSQAHFVPVDNNGTGSVKSRREVMALSLLQTHALFFNGPIIIFDEFKSIRNPGARRR